MSLKNTFVAICEGRDSIAGFDGQVSPEQTRFQNYKKHVRGFWGFVANIYTGIILVPASVLLAIPTWLYALAIGNNSTARIFLAPFRVVNALAQNLATFMMKHSFALKVATLGLALALSFGLLVAFPPAGIFGVIGFGGQLAATLGLASLNVGLYATVISALTFAATSVLGSLAYLAKKCFVCSNEKIETHKKFKSSQADMQSGLEIDEYLSHSTVQKSKRGTNSCFVRKEKESSHTVTFHKKTGVLPLDNIGTFVADKEDSRLKIG